MISSFSRKMDFPPEIKIVYGSMMETITVKTILDVQISEDLKWKYITDLIVIKAHTKVWILKRLSPFQLSHQKLFDVYSKEVRSI